MYMLLSLVTGIFYFTVVVTGLSLSLGLFILIIGIPFALLFIGIFRVLGHVGGTHRGRSAGGPNAAKTAPRHRGRRRNWTQIQEALVDMRTWSTMFYLALMLPLGIAYFTIAVVGISLSLGFFLGSIGV